jgi:hypothetical protein
MATEKSHTHAGKAVGEGHDPKSQILTQHHEPEPEDGISTKDSVQGALDSEKDHGNAPAARMSPFQTVILTLALCVSHTSLLPPPFNLTQYRTGMCFPSRPRHNNYHHRAPNNSGAFPQYRRLCLGRRSLHIGPSCLYPHLGQIE